MFNILNDPELSPSALQRVVNGDAVIRGDMVVEDSSEEEGDFVGAAGFVEWLRAKRPEHPALAFCSLARIPVPPPNARPFVSGLSPTMVDPWIGPLNELWVDLVDCARRYLRLIELDAPQIIIDSEQRRTQLAFNAVFGAMRPPPQLVPALHHVPDELEAEDALRLAWLSPEALVIQQRDRVSIVGTDGTPRFDLPPAGCVLRGVIDGRIALFQEFLPNLHPAFADDSGFPESFVRRSAGGFINVRPHVEMSAIDGFDGRYLIEPPKGLPRAFIGNDQPEDLFYEPTDGGPPRKIRAGGDRPSALAYTNDLRFGWAGEVGSGTGTVVIEQSTGIPQAIPIEPDEGDPFETFAFVPRDDTKKDEEEEEYEEDYGGSAVAFCEGEWRFVWSTGFFADHRAKRIVRFRPAPRAAAFAPDGNRLAVIVGEEVVLLALPDLKITNRFPLPG